MIVELETLLDELARRHARGEPLDVEGTLAKAGDRADELAPLIEAFLERAPRRAPQRRGARATSRSLDDPPMLRARVAKALRVDDVVDAIVAACEIRPDARPKVRRYYQQLEGGVLDPSRVAASVWDAITKHSRPFARVADGAASRRCGPPRPHVPRRQALRGGRDADAVERRWRSRNRPTRSTRCSSATRASRERSLTGFPSLRSDSSTWAAG